MDPTLLTFAHQYGLNCADCLLCLAMMPDSPHCDMWERNAYQWAVRAAHYARRANLSI